MVDITAIENEIKAIIESKETMSYHTLEQLSLLYSIRSHLREDYRLLGQRGGSDFIDAAQGVAYQNLIAILDESLDKIKINRPKEYQAIIEHLRNSQ